MASSNTSKTAHVMNLLSRNRGGAAESAAETAAAAESHPEAAAQAVPQAEAVPTEPARTPPVAPIISSINADAAVSTQIKDALEAELEETLAPAPRKAAPVGQTAPIQQTDPVPQADSAQQADPVPQAESAQQAEPAQQAESVQQAEPAPQAEPAQQADPAPQAEPAQQAEPVQQSDPAEAERPMDLPARHEEPAVEEPSYVNIMQILVEEKADEYMKMFGICCCDVCRMDVRAYALNHLPPKYVVMSRNERIPRLTVYENRFASDITAQIIQACKQVMLTPHHSRDND